MSRTIRVTRLDTKETLDMPATTPTQCDVYNHPLSVRANSGLAFGPIRVMFDGAPVVVGVESYRERAERLEADIDGYEALLAHARAVFGRIAALAIPWSSGIAREIRVLAEKAASDLASLGVEAPAEDEAMTVFEATRAWRNRATAAVMADAETPEWSRDLSDDDVIERWCAVEAEMRRRGLAEAAASEEST